MRVYRKQWAAAPAGFFAAEAAGLDWLAAAAQPGLRVAGVPDRPAWEATAIAVEYLPGCTPTSAAAAAGGRALARLHAAGAAAFGAPPDGWEGPTFIGRQPQACRPWARWGEFYATDRVWPFAEKAHRIGDLTTAELQVVERACAVISTGVFDPEGPPARIHGDLWAGNVLWVDEGVGLIDPAAHGGHPATDIAMLELFGAPYLEEFVASYAEVTPLPPVAVREAVHHLHPLAVHAAGQGRQYGVQLAARARATLALAGD